MITKPFLRSLREDIAAALIEVGAKHNVDLMVGNATFAETSANFRLEVKLVGNQGETILSDMDKRSIVAEINHPDVTLENVQGFTFGPGGKFKLTGFNGRSPKHCLKIMSDGKGAKCSGAFVRQELHRRVPTKY